MPFPWLAGAVAGSAAGSFFSAREQNSMAGDRSREAMAFSAQEAQKQMDFQERMSGTAHQREVADLKAAGLNPILSANAGADSPGGASGSGFQSPVVPEVGALVSSAADSIRLFSDFQSAQAGVEASKAQALSARASAKKAGVETDILKADEPERRLGGKVYELFNGLFDRVKSFSAKSMDAPQGVDPEVGPVQFNFPPPGDSGSWNTNR